VETEALDRLRAAQCRLTADRALATLDEAEEFLRDRGMLTRTADCSLPSLYEACHEDPYREGSAGFATWPATKWPWFGTLSARGYPSTAVHRGKNIMFSAEAARLADPICRAEIGRMRAEDKSWRRVLDHLAAAGPGNVDDIARELGLKRQEMKAQRTPLERCGAVVSYWSAAGQEGPFSRDIARWDQVYRGPGWDADPRAALRELVLAGVRAAVVAPERELSRWFSWQWYWTGSLVDDLIRDGRLRRVAGSVTAVSR
jgi:hypothetical protein